MFLFSFKSWIHCFCIIFSIFICLAYPCYSVLSLLATCVTPINLTVNTNWLIAVHAEELILSLRMILTISEISWLFSYFYSNMLLKEGRGLVSLFIAVITVVALIIFTVNCGLLSAIIITVLLQIR